MIVPIPKSTNKSDAGNNNRPVSLTCILCKLLEKHVCQVMKEHLEETNQICDNQWRFRSGRSTTTALISVTHDWYCALDNGDEVGVVFFDFCKAFDKVPHNPLLLKLQSMSFNWYIVCWVKKFLSLMVTVCHCEWNFIKHSQSYFRCPTGLCPGPHAITSMICWTAIWDLLAVKFKYMLMIFYYIRP